MHFVVVFNLTRFARDKYDHFPLRSLLQSLGISLRSATEPIDDTSTGKLTEGVLAAFAQFDNDCRSDRTRAGMRAALELGRWTFLAPIGYLNAPRAMGKSLMADAERAPIVRRVFESVILAEGYRMKPGESVIAPSQVIVSSGYFEAMGAELSRGRYFDERDTADSPRVVIADDRLARRFWPAQDPIGRRLYRPDDLSDHELPVFETQTMAERTDRSLVDRRSPMVLSVAFGLIALFLSAIGIYGVLAYLVTQRTREIGIRIALGRTGAAVVRMVLHEGLILIVGGLGLGAAGATVLTRSLESQLFGVSPIDPVVMSVAIATLALVALGACALPAHRAARIDPVAVLRES